MTQEEKEFWVAKMKACNSDDWESAHCEADSVLCELVEKYCPFGKEVVEEYDKIGKWYA